MAAYLRSLPNRDAIRPKLGDPDRLIERAVQLEAGWLPCRLVRKLSLNARFVTLTSRTPIASRTDRLPLIAAAPWQGRANRVSGDANLKAHNEGSDESR
jgi:hypothetical protein